MKTFSWFYLDVCSLPGNIENVCMSVLGFEPGIVRFEIWHTVQCTKQTIFVEITKLNAINFKLYTAQL